jgi:hypothetical protein
LADPSATPDIESRKAASYGLKHGDSVSDAVWQRVLRALDKVDDSLIMRIRDITFETSTEQSGPDGEVGYCSYKEGSKMTKKIVLYQGAITQDDMHFSVTLAHELDTQSTMRLPTKPGKLDEKAMVHNLSEFQKAARQDGGRANAITDYRKKSDKEFFAECLAFFVQQPDTFRVLRPNIYNYFVAYESAAVKDPPKKAP